MGHHIRFQVLHNLFLWLVLPLLINPVLADSNVIHHQLQVKLQPAQSRLVITDNIQFPSGTTEASFSLNSRLSVTASSGNLEKLTKTAENQLHYYQLSRLPQNGKVQLEIQGEFESQQRKDLFGMPRWIFDNKQLYLDGGSGWFPSFDKFPWLSFDLQVSAPASWQIISQGKRTLNNGIHTYHMPHPQDDIYLLGGPFQRYAQMHDDIEIEVYLHEENPALAQKYLNATAPYLSHFSDIIGSYPYAKFAVVENRWQTGYGMPSFTLLGSRVIRLPFILYTSLPHEILHNWWGNGVFIDYTDGNWSEGLTAYMADHANSEQKLQDSEYRRKALERYANFAAKQRDFALTDFTSRHNEASQANGYSKSLMLFHMLRKQLGDEQFQAAIQRFWQNHQFKPATFIDLIGTLTQNSDINTELFIEQWLSRVGAPELKLQDARLIKQESGHLLEITIQQQQPDPAYEMKVPLSIRFADQSKSQTEHLTLNSKTSHFSIPVRQQPNSVTLDRDYDVFRLLHPDERPSSLGRLFGAQQQVLVYPASAPESQQQAWIQLAAAWDKKYGNVKIIKDTEMKKLPNQAAIWLLGWQNSLLDQFQSSLTHNSQQLLSNKVMLDDEYYNAEEHAVVMLDADSSRPALGFIGADDSSSIQALARKLPHYNSYGMLVFSLPSVTNILKQPLKVLTSPMTRQL